MYEDLARELQEREFNKGVSHGIEQGTLQTKLDTTKKLFELNISKDIIIKATGLSLEDIENI